MSRQRSVWGWGWADRFPDREARSALGQTVEAMLGRPPPQLADPVPEEQIRLSGGALPVANGREELLSRDRLVRARHAHGRGYADLVRGFRGDFTAAPDAVAFPSRDEEIDALFDWCAKEQLALIPFGGGTSVVRGVERPESGHRGAISLDLAKWDRVLEVDHRSRAARIQAGVLGPSLEAQLAEHGLTLRHYPQSFEFSSLGGWIATRAGGHYATGRTRIDDFVEALTLRAPGGVIQTRRFPSSGAGPAAERWVLGSEGAFGVITEAWLRLTERPRYRSRCSVRFATFGAGAEAARQIVQAGLTPANCRLLDGQEALLNGVSADGRAVLLLAFESADHPAVAAMERAAQIAADAGGERIGEVRHSDPREQSAQGPEDAERWRDAFFSAPYLQNVMVSLGIIADTFETAVTWDRFEALHRGVIEAVEDALTRIAGAGRVTCRLTHLYPDGAAPYFTFLAPAKVGSEIGMWIEIKSAAAEAVLRHGGTITHHHAVGRLHRPWYDRERPPAFAAAMAAVKRTLDPAGILNPGVLFDR
jgi:alkyldihydroxyacetonephosphate synthase